ncbi:hypothetical protein [Xylanimonas protaetiae]|uniref:Uncharacterized protein n=1 Tax=Xylanimonas protaetiae TaxID=2509457 RepID=A0A4P6FED7_9MICO|nr:hypothetical protein [Xylanimonas protaetiae]QAY68968.1 hypothetical protein ET471_02020 [Xylanimonas protaetiae]
MRLPITRGATSLRRPSARLAAVVLLGAGLALVGSSASAATLHATGGGFDWRTYTASHQRWGGGSGTSGGMSYTWPQSTYDYDANVCPDMDEPKSQEVDELTVTLHAPEGKLISAYCVKAGSDKQGLGPKIVVLDTPAAEVTIAYADVAKHSCKKISHYSVAYVDAPPTSAPPVLTATPAASPTPTTSATPTPAATPTATRSATPTPTPAPSVSGSPFAAPSPAPAPSEAAPSPSPSVSLAPFAAPSPSASSSSSSPAAVVPSSAPSPGARLAATDDAERVEDTGRLAFTGAQVTGVLVAAVVLVALGTLAVHTTRSRRSTRA